jgi:osmotically inducible protein OsmC
MEWTGGLLDGSGVAKAGTGAFVQPMTFASRIGEGDGRTTPEEMIAGAHAACYAMGLVATIGRQGGKAAKVRVTATVMADKGDAGIKLMSSHLAAIVEGLQGIDHGRLTEIAQAAEKGCPVSNALRGNLTITVEAKAV